MRSFGWFLVMTAFLAAGCLSTGNEEPTEGSADIKSAPVKGPIGDNNPTVGKGLQSVTCGSGTASHRVQDWTYFIVTPCEKEQRLPSGITTNPGNSDPWNNEAGQPVKRSGFTTKKEDLLRGCQQWVAQRNSGKPRSEQFARCETESVYLGCTPEFALGDEKNKEKFTKQASWFGKIFSPTDEQFPLQGANVASVQLDCRKSTTERYPALYATRLIYLEGVDKELQQDATIFFTSPSDAALFSQTTGGSAATKSLTPAADNGGAGGGPLGGIKPAVNFGGVTVQNPGLDTAATFAETCAVMASTSNFRKTANKQTGRCFTVDYIRDYCFLDYDNQTRWTLPSERPKQPIPDSKPPAQQTLIAITPPRPLTQLPLLPSLSNPNGITGLPSILPGAP